MVGATGFEPVTPCAQDIGTYTANSLLSPLEKVICRILSTLEFCVVVDFVAVTFLKLQ